MSLISVSSAEAQSEIQYIDFGLQVTCAQFRGAGFYLSERVVVTAKHVVEDCVKVIIENSSGDKTFSTSVKLSSKKDLAYLSVESSISPIVQITEVPPVGSEVFTVGSPIDGLLLSKGKLKDLFRDLSEEFLVLDIPADHGSSGGPVFSQSGLIGLVVSKDEENGDIYAYKGEDIEIDFKLVSERGSSSQDFHLPVGSCGLDILISILVSAIISFVLGVGVGVMITRRRVKTSKPRIRIQI